MLLTTHYMEEAARLADRVAIMDHGRFIALDTPADGQILDTPQAVFSGTVSDGTELSVNGSPVLLTRGAFSAMLDVNEGRNSFNIIAKNGPRAAAQTVVVYYLPSSQASPGSTKALPQSEVLQACGSVRSSQ